MTTEDKEEILNYISENGCSLWDCIEAKLDMDLYQYTRGHGRSQTLFEQGYAAGIRHSIKIIEDYKRLRASTEEVL